MDDYAEKTDINLDKSKELFNTFKQELLNIISKNGDSFAGETIDKIKNMLTNVDIKDKDLFYRFENKIKDINTDFDESKIKELGNPPDKKTFIENLKTLKDGYNTGYSIETNTGKEDIIFKAGALTFISAPTKHGKTTAMFNFFINILQVYKDKIHYFFSYEEAEHALLTKLASCYIDMELSANNYNTLKDYYKKGSKEYFNSGYNDSILFNKFMKKENEYWELIKQSRIVYKNYDLSELTNILNIIGKNKDTGCIFIDYLQLIPVSMNTNRYEIIKELCNTLKDVAVSNNLSIVIATQFNRQAQNPESLLLQNLSEGSDIEKSANQIIGLWHFGKPAIKNQNITKKYNDYYDSKDKALIKIMANRDGEGDIENIFKVDYNRKKIYNETEKIDYSKKNNNLIDNFN